MRILITGGAGFVGSNLALATVRRFAGAQVVCMDNLYGRGSELKGVDAIVQETYAWVSEHDALLGKL